MANKPPMFRYKEKDYRADKDNCARVDGKIVAVYVPEIGRFIPTKVTGQKKEPGEIVAHRVRDFGEKRLLGMWIEKDSDGVAVLVAPGLFVDPTGEYVGEKGNKFATAKLGETVYGRGRGIFRLESREAVHNMIADLQALETRLPATGTAASPASE